MGKGGHSPGQARLEELRETLALVRPMPRDPTGQRGAAERMRKTEEMRWPTPNSNEAKEETGVRGQGKDRGEDGTSSGRDPRFPPVACQPPIAARAKATEESKPCMA